MSKFVFSKIAEHLNDDDKELHDVNMLGIGFPMFPYVPDA